MSFLDKIGVAVERELSIEDAIDAAIVANGGDELKLSFSKVNRVEVFDPYGVCWAVGGYELEGHDVSISFQDDGQTLRVFVKRKS